MPLDDKLQVIQVNKILHHHPFIVAASRDDIRDIQMKHGRTPPLRAEHPVPALPSLDRIFTSDVFTSASHFALALARHLVCAEIDENDRQIQTDPGYYIDTAHSAKLQIFQATGWYDSSIDL